MSAHLAEARTAELARGEAASAAEQRHLHGCPACAAELRRVEALQHELAEIPFARAPDLRASATLRFREARRHRDTLRLLVALWLGTAAAGAISIGAAALLIAGARSLLLGAVQVLKSAVVGLHAAAAITQHAPVLPLALAAATLGAACLSVLALNRILARAG